MIKYDQTILGYDPANGVFGDCFRVCLACLMEIHPNDIPNFAEKASWWEDSSAWLLNRGLGFLEVPYFSEDDYRARSVGHHLIAGPSPRSTPNNIFWHCVVGLRGKIVHDPHPSRAGLAGNPREWASRFLVYLGRRAGDI